MSIIGSDVECSSDSSASSDMMLGDEEEEEVNEREMVQLQSKNHVSAKNTAKTQNATKKSAVKTHNATKKARKADDPYDSAVFEPADSMADEMQAMKQVFLRMSEKKIQQKEERKAECKRLYKDAFRSDVDQIFKRANKNRVKTMDEVSDKIKSLSKELQTSMSQLSQAHAAYKKKFSTEFERASSEIAMLKCILQEADAQYARTTKQIDAEFQKIEDGMEVSLQKLKVKLEEAAKDKTFVHTFKPQLERLL